MDNKPKPTFKLSAASLSQGQGSRDSSANSRFLLSSGQQFTQFQPKPESTIYQSTSDDEPVWISTVQKTGRSQSQPTATTSKAIKEPSATSTSTKFRSTFKSQKEFTSHPQPRASTSKQAQATQSTSKCMVDSDSDDPDDIRFGNIRIDNDIDMEDDNNNDSEEDSGSDASSIDSDTFKESYQNLTMDAKKIGRQLQHEKLQKSKEILDNVLEGQGLAVRMGSSSTKAVTAWEHTAAIAETFAAQARQCGTVCNIFSADRYLDLLMGSCRDEYGQYDPDLLSKKMLENYVGCSRRGTSGMATMLGLLDFSELGDPEEPSSQAPKTRRRIQFSQKLTQHEVVNTQVKQKESKEKNKTLTASKRKSEAIESACKQREQPSVPLVIFAMSGAEKPGDFLQNVFDVAVAARDGYASLENPDDPDGYRPDNNHELVIQATEPPATYSEGTLDVRRNQHIVSFSAKQMREMLCKKKVEPKKYPTD